MPVGVSGTATAASDCSDQSQSCQEHGVGFRFGDIGYNSADIAGVDCHGITLATLDFTALYSLVGAEVPSTGPTLSVIPVLGVL